LRGACGYLRGDFGRSRGRCGKRRGRSGRLRGRSGGLGGGAAIDADRCGGGAAAPADRAEDAVGPAGRPAGGVDVAGGFAKVRGRLRGRCGWRRGGESDLGESCAGRRAWRVICYLSSYYETARG
jgi:hypothetical protein